MSKKYYWPTSWDNLGIILTNGYIAPETVYAQMLADGVTINLADYSLTESAITLFGDLPSVEINTSASVISEPAIIEISEDCIIPDKLSPINEKAKIYNYRQPIFFNVSNIKVIFFSDGAKDGSMSRLSSAAEIKDLASYQKGFVVKDKSNKLRDLRGSLPGLFTETDNKPYSVEESVKKIRLNDGVQGTYMGLIAGIFFQKSSGERDISGLLQEIKNKYAGAKSELMMSKDRSIAPKDARLPIEVGNFAELKELIIRLSKEIEHWEFAKNTMGTLLELQQRIRLSRYYPDKVDAQLKKYLKVYSRYSELSVQQEKAMAYFLKNPVEWLMGEDLVLAPHSIEEMKVLFGPEWFEELRVKADIRMMMEPAFIAYKLRCLLNGSMTQVSSRELEVNFNKLMENLQSCVEEYFKDMNSIKLKEYNVNDFEFLVVDDPNSGFSINHEWLRENNPQDYKVWQLIMTQLLKEAANRTKIEIKNNGWQYEERISFIKGLIDPVESLGLEGELIADIKLIQKALESSFEGSTRIDDIRSPIMANLFAFLFKYKDLEQLERYLNQKMVDRSYYAWCFWSAFFGYSSVPKKYVDSLFKSWNKKEIEAVRTCMTSIHLQLFN